MQRRQRGHEEGWLLSYADLITNLLLFFIVLLSAANLSKGRMQQITKAISGEQQAQSLATMKAELDEKIREKNLTAVVSTTEKEDDVELTFNSSVVFDSGKAEIKPEFSNTLNEVFALLAPYTSKYHFAVEGHTDSTPLAGGGQFPSNWELSAARAIVVRDRLEKNGVGRERIRVEGYADTKPVPAAELVAVPPEEQKARQRRVVVRVY
jgi:chemotaxis protein MotB